MALVPFPKCICGCPVSGLMRTTAGHYFLLHHGRAPWRCSVSAGCYADVAETLADLNRRGARDARIVARHQSQSPKDDAVPVRGPDKRDLIERFQQALPTMDLQITEIFSMGVEAAFRELLPTHTRIDKA